MISVSIVSFNTVNDLSRCIDSLLSITQLNDYEILINAFNYTNENKNILKQKYNNIPNISIIYESGIRGYSANHNINIDRAKYNLICILNDDTYIEEDILIKFYTEMQTSNIAACCPIFYNYDGTVQYLFRKKVNPLWYLFQVVKLGTFSAFFDVYESKNKLNNLIQTKTIEIDYFLGICVCLKRNALPSGKLDETFFLGPDDLYWSYLIKQNKTVNKILLLTQSKVFHKGHTSISQHFSSALPAQIKGMIELFEKMGFRFLHIFRLILIPFLFLHFIYHKIRNMIYKDDRSLRLKDGYYNSLRIIWHHSSTAAIFRFFSRKAKTIR